MKLNLMSNAAWMMSEKVVSIAGVIFVTAYVAKSFGPAVFGQMAFATSLFTLVQSVSIFGSETILFKRFSQNITKGLRLIPAVRALRLLLLLVTAIPVLLWVGLTMPDNFFTFSLAAAAASFFITQDTFSVYNNARLASRLNAVANSLGMALSFAGSFTIAWLHLHPAWLACPVVTLALVPYLIKRHGFSQHVSIIAPPAEKRRLYWRHLVYAGLPLAISSIFISVQVRAAQMLLTWLAPASEPGLFAAANTVAASWLFIPVALITSCFTEIFQARGEAAIKLTARLHGYVMMISLPVLAAIALAGEHILNALYGAQYSRSGSLLFLLSLATCFSALGTVAYRYMVKEGGFTYLLYKILGLIAINLPLAWWLIQQYGITGAAWSVLLCELLSLTVMNYFFKNGVIRRIQISSLNYKTYK